MRVEEAGVQGYRVAHHVQPFVVVLVVGGDDLLLELLVEVDGVERLVVVVGEVPPVRFGPDGPARHVLDPALDPPSVEHGEVHDPVQGAFHAAGPAGLAGAHRGVEPKVDALGYQGCDLHVVVVDEDDGDGLLQVPGRLADLLEQGLAAVVAGMGFPREDELHLTVPRHLQEPLEVGEEQVGPLVGRGAPREPQGEHLGVQLPSGRLQNPGEQAQLGCLMRGPEVLHRDGQGLDQTAGILLPSGDVPVVELPHPGAHPGGGVDAVRDPVHRLHPEHGVAHLGVLLGDAVHVAAVLQPQLGHGDPGDVGHHALERAQGLRREDPVDQAELEIVVSRRDGRVGREHDLLADLVGVVVALLAHELEGQEAGVSLVEVEGLDVHVAQVAQHPQPPDAQDELLTETVAVVPAVEVPAELAVVGMVGFEVRVQEVDGQGVPGGPDDLVDPYPHLDLPSLKVDQDAVGQERQLVGGVPLDGLLLLPVVGVELLDEVALAVEQGDPRHGDAEVGGALQNVAGQDPQPSRVGGDGLLEPDLHGEIGQRPEGRVVLHEAPEGIAEIAAMQSLYHSR